MGIGRREVEKESRRINILKVILVIMFIVVVIIGIYFLVKNLGKQTNEDYNEKIEDALVQEVEEVKEKTIEEIVSEFGGEIKEQVNNDTYYIMKDGKEYTAYLDGDVVEGRIAIWNGTASQPAVDEAGNLNIYNAEELKWVADQVISGAKNFSGVTITLRQHIDLGARKNDDGSWSGTLWTPIIGFLDELPKTENINQTQNEVAVQEEVYDDSVNVTKENLKRFAGVFNGNGFSIRGLNIDSDKRYEGLFGFNAGIISNLTIKNSNIKGGTGVGAIAGLNSGTIENCYLENVEVKGNEKVGGFAGISMENSRVDRCNITGDNTFVYADKYAGGIIGYTNNNATILNCSNRANVTGKDYIGGISGIIFYGTTVQNSSNMAMNVVGENYVGGIAGYSLAQIQNSYNHNTDDKNGIVSGNNYVGGIVGLNYTMGNITDSYNSGEIIIKGDNGGGIAGLNNASISNTYNTGKINAEETNGAKIGGICGQNISESYIYTSYNTGNISVKNSGDGVVGANFGTVENCFYLETTINSQNTENARNDDDMKNSILSNLGESFKTDTENKNSGYPILSWQ